MREALASTKTRADGASADMGAWAMARAERERDHCVGINESLRVQRLTAVAHLL